MPPKKSKASVKKEKTPTITTRTRSSARNRGKQKCYAEEEDEFRLSEMIDAMSDDGDDADHSPPSKATKMKKGSGGVLSEVGVKSERKVKPERKVKSEGKVKSEDKKPAAKARKTQKKKKSKLGGVDLRSKIAREKNQAELEALAAASGAEKITEVPNIKSGSLNAGAQAGRANAVGGFKLKRDSDSETRYEISLAPTGRAYCKVDGTPIAKGALRWTVYKGGIQFGGFRKLQNVSSRILHNAVNAHQSLSNIHGLDSIPPEAAIAAIQILKGIAVNGSIGDRGKGGKGKGKKKAKAKSKAKTKKAKKTKGKGTEVAEEEDPDEDDGWIEMATLSLDEMLNKKLAEAKKAGELVEIDCSDEESADGKEATVEVAEPEMEKVRAESESESDSDPADSSDSDDDNFMDVDDDEIIDRDPTDGDMILVKWENDDNEYLCRVQGIAGSGEQNITSCDGSFEETWEFNPRLDIWRFSKGSSKKPKAAKKVKVAANPKQVKMAAAKKIASAKGARPDALKGLRFVITGETSDFPGDSFKNHVSGMIEATGGRITTGVSNVTDYLVAGTIHYNPFLGTRGPIENGSKYKKALQASKCKIIDIEFLQGLVDGSQKHCD